MRSSASAVLKPSRFELAPARVIVSVDSEEHDEPIDAIPPVREVGNGNSQDGASPAARPRFYDEIIAARQQVDDMLRRGHEAAEHIIAEARDEAGEVRRRTEEQLAQAQRALAQAQEQADALRNQYRSEGHAAGMAEAQEAMAAEIARLTSLADNALAARKELLARAEPELVELAVAIAEKALAQELTVHPEAVIGIAREALALTTAAERRTLLLHPKDAERVRERGREILDDTGWEIVADPDLSPGDCIVRTAHGRVDARLSTRLERARCALLGEQHDDD